MKQFIIGENEAGQRFDKYLKKRLPLAASSFLYKMLRKKNITLNGKKADGSEKLNVKDEICLFLSDETYEKFIKMPRTAAVSKEVKPSRQAGYPRAGLNILYESRDILVINKPAGMLSQKAKAEDKSANEYIIAYLLDTKKITLEELETFKPSVVNRLDRNTSGILIAGKTLKGLQEMSAWLRRRELEKYYLCLVNGQVKSSFHLKGWMVKDPGKNRVMVYDQERPEASYIETGFVPVKAYGSFTLLEVQLITGRSHQIRAHLAAASHPVAGDSKYGDPTINRFFAQAFDIHRQLLHANRLRLPDGTEVTAELPGDFQEVLHVLGK